MDQEEIFSNLPPEIILNIISRIPIKTVFTCKCVCKSWLGLLETPEFARSHLSKSVPGLLIYRFTGTNVFRIVEFEDSLENEHHELQTVLELDINKNFNLRYGGSSMFIEGSANGLLFLRDRAPPRNDHYLCNPITREYMKLPKPEGIPNYGTMVTCGFGASRLSNQYKVVRIFHDCLRDSFACSLSIPKSVLQVYTLGTGSWRDIMSLSEMSLDFGYGSTGKLLNGNLHWLAMDLNGARWIPCFDLETDAFTKFGAPTVEYQGSFMELGVLRDRLCLCDNSSENEISIYMVNDYGDEKKSWTKEYAISKIRHPGQPYNVMLCAVKAFGNGDILMTSGNFCMFCCSNRTKTVSLVYMFDEDVTALVEAVMYTPSFISLKNFETENAKCLSLYVL